MIESGERAPSFTLPAVRDGDVEEVALDPLLGEDIVILAFYPGDFNPACSERETGLDELDLFTMQKDVTVLAISGDSIYSHRAFAEQYDLNMPLLSDTDGSVAKRYGVAVDDEQAGYLTHRAVFVVDHSGAVQYTWTSEQPRAVPTAEEIRRSVEGVGDDRTAESRYRVGHAHYIEGRRAFTSAMKAYEGNEWMMAQTDFEQAAEEFDEAADEFDTAVRFAEGPDVRTYFERAEDKAEALWRAADWLAESASAFASGEGAEADSLREDAEAPLETARELHEPPPPDDFPPEEDPAESDRDDQPDYPLTEQKQPKASLDADIDAEATRVEPDREETRPESAGADPDHGEPSESIDEAELEEITAELEEQTGTAERTDPEPESDDGSDDGGNDTDDDSDAEFELTDPADESEEDEDSGDAGYGVPDSL